jgi:hypothetical protein
MQKPIELVATASQVWDFIGLAVHDVARFVVLLTKESVLSNWVLIDSHSIAIGSDLDCEQGSLLVRCNIHI